MQRCAGGGGVAWARSRSPAGAVKRRLKGQRWSCSVSVCGCVEEELEWRSWSGAPLWWLRRCCWWWWSGRCVQGVFDRLCRLRVCVFALDAWSLCRIDDAMTCDASLESSSFESSAVRDQRGYVVVVTGVLYGTTRRSLHPVESWTAVHCGPNLALLPTYVYRQPPLPPLSLSFSAPLPRRGHRSQFILPTPLPGARYSLRLAIPSSLCLSYHSARPELQCGYPPFTAHPPCARRQANRQSLLLRLEISVQERSLHIVAKLHVIVANR